MNKSPAFLFYPNDYLGGTIGFSFEMHGAYILMLMFQYSNGKFTTEQANSVIGNELFGKIKNKFATEIINDIVYYYSLRLDLEINKRYSYSKSRQNNRQTTSILHQNEKSYVEHMGNGNGNNSNSISINNLECEIKQENTNNENNRTFIKPSIEEVKDYCQKRENSIDAGAFIDHYESNGWKVGKSPMKDWQSAVRTWERNQKTFSNYPPGRSNRPIFEYEKNAPSKYEGIRHAS